LTVKAGPRTHRGELRERLIRGALVLAEGPKPLGVSAAYSQVGVQRAITTAWARHIMSRRVGVQAH